MHDPRADPEAARKEYGLTLLEAPRDGAYDALVLAVAHAGFGPEVLRFVRTDGVVQDLKGVLPRDRVDLRL